MEAGSWTDRGRTGIASSSSKSYNAIDGNLFKDGSTYYMNFGSFWHGLYQAPMNSDATKVATSSYNLAYDSSGTHAVEGAYMYQYGNYYYLFYSAGICCGYDTSRPASGAEYKIKVCRSATPTSGFVCFSAFPCCSPVLITSYSRSINPALRVPAEVEQSFLKVTAPSTALVDSKFSEGLVLSCLAILSHIFKGRIYRFQPRSSAILPLCRHHRGICRWPKALRVEQDRFLKRVASGLNWALLAWLDQDILQV
jgi:hypothetical protein